MYRVKVTSTVRLLLEQRALMAIGSSVVLFCQVVAMTVYSVIACITMICTCTSSFGSCCNHIAKATSNRLR